MSGTTATAGETPLENLGYALIGVRVGLRFTRASLRSIAKLLPLATLLILAVIAACGLLGVVLSKVTGVASNRRSPRSSNGCTLSILPAVRRRGRVVIFSVTRRTMGHRSLCTSRSHRARTAAQSPLHRS